MCDCEANVTEYEHNNVPVCIGAGVPVEQCVLTPGELVLCRHRALHQLGFDQPGAKAIGVFGVMLGGHRKRNISVFVLENRIKTQVCIFIGVYCIIEWF